MYNFHGWTVTLLSQRGEQDEATSAVCVYVSAGHICLCRSVCLTTSTCVRGIHACVPMGNWTWGLGAAAASPLSGCSLTAYALPFSLSCKGGDFSVPVDVTRGSYVSSSSSRKKIAEDFPSGGESSAAWQAGAFRCLPGVTQGAPEGEGASVSPVSPPPALASAQQGPPEQLISDSPQSPCLGMEAKI